jgi:hypothetical protein
MKKTALDKAIESLDYQIAVLTTARLKLIEQVKIKSSKEKVTKPRPVGAQTA